MHYDYLILRLIRHFMPHSFSRVLLKRRWIIRPGLETRDPSAAKDQYQEILTNLGESFTGKRVMVFGYGGNFTLGCILLQTGVEHVVLVDKYAPPDEQVNASLLPEYSDYLESKHHQILPRKDTISLIQADIRQVANQKEIPPVDLVISMSVYEHLDDINGITRALSTLTKSNGLNIHHIDLRDHFFRYPFEMLTFSENTWKKWLNPTSNLNRYRVPDYERAFKKYFQEMQLIVKERNYQAFNETRNRIQPEFLTGDPDIDAVTKITMVASSPVSP